MASVQTPNGVEAPANGRAQPPRFAGDEAVPHGLAVASAVTLRVVIVVGGIVLLGLIAKRMMVVVLPVIISLLLATLLAPPARALARRGLGPGPSALLAVLLALVVFLGLWGLVIPPFVAQVPDVVENVQKGAGQIADAASPLGITADDAQNVIRKGREELSGGKVAGTVLS